MTDSGLMVWIYRFQPAPIYCRIQMFLQQLGIIGVQPVRCLNMAWWRILRGRRAEIAVLIGHQTGQPSRPQHISFITAAPDPAQGNWLETIFLGNKPRTQARQAQFVGDSTWNTTEG